MNMKWLSVSLTGTNLVGIKARIKPVLGSVRQQTLTNSVFSYRVERQNPAPPPHTWTQSTTHEQHFHIVLGNYKHISSFIAKTYRLYPIIGIIGQILHSNIQRKVNNDENRQLPHKMACTIVSNVTKCCDDHNGRNT